MYKPGKLLAVIIVVVIIVAAYSVYANDTVTVSVQGLGDVTGEMTIMFTDGTSVTVTKIKTGTTFVQYDGKSVSKLSFDCSVNPKERYGDKVQLLCNGADDAHMSKVVVKAGATTMTTIATYPLSLTEKDNYVSLTSGQVNLLWDDIETTRAEMIETPWGIGTFKVVWEVYLWWNVDIDSREVHGAKVVFTLPFQVHTIYVLDPTPDPDDKEGSGNILDPTPGPFKKGSYSILMAKTEVTNLGTVTVSKAVASWTI